MSDHDCSGEVETCVTCRNRQVVEWGPDPRGADDAADRDWDDRERWRA